MLDFLLYRDYLNNNARVKYRDNLLNKTSIVIYPHSFLVGYVHIIVWDYSFNVL